MTKRWTKNERRAGHRRRSALGTIGLGRRTLDKMVRTSIRLGRYERRYVIPQIEAFYAKRQAEMDELLCELAAATASLLQTELRGVASPHPSHGDGAGDDDDERDPLTGQLVGARVGIKESSDHG